jgi:carbonic anhydrase
VETDQSATRADEPNPGPLELLRQGNTRFVRAVNSAPDPEAVRTALSEASPYAVVLGCSDSRVAPEIVFDESLGYLFVVRVASHVAGPAEIGSVEYAIARWGCGLVVILGHSQCGGVAAAMTSLPPGAEPAPDASGSTNLTSMLSSIRSNLGWVPPSDSADPWLEAVEINVRRTCETLFTWSPVIRQRVASGALKVVGAIYHVETGEVEFLDQPG